MLDFLGIEKGRTRVEWVSAGRKVPKFAKTMNEFVRNGNETRVKTDGWRISDARRKK